MGNDDEKILNNFFALNKKRFFLELVYERTNNFNKKEKKFFRENIYSETIDISLISNTQILKRK